MEDNAGIPEDLRCKRSDGKQWRCSARSMPDKTVCEKHYIQAKKRAANSALRASLKKARRRSIDEDDVYLESKRSDLSPLNFAGGEFSGTIAAGKKYREKAPKGRPGMYSQEVIKGSSARGGGVLRSCEEVQRDGVQDGENRVRSLRSMPPIKEAKNFNVSGLVDHSGKSSDSSGGAMGLICHQCQRSGRLTWCISCDRRGYCGSCISRWYAEIPVDEVRQVCPACRGICNCRVCLRGDNLIKAKVKEIAAIDKLRYLHRLLVFVLPVLKKIYAEQFFEIGVETRVYGPKVDIPRAKLNADEQMCCDCCKTPVFDYHRHCTKCSYDLCLTCCRDIRQASSIAVRGESTECQVTDRGKDAAAAAAVTVSAESSAERTTDKSTSTSEDEHAIEFSHLFPTWKANRDGSIPCGSAEAGGCGSSKLILRRILKMNWVAKLVKNAEEMVKGCKICDADNSDKCVSCRGSRTSHSSRLSEVDLVRCSSRDASSDNLLYCPMLDDIKHEGISHFQKHWVKGEPVIIKHAFERSLASSWDPLSIWRGIHETIDEKIDGNATVKAVEYLNQSEVDIELNKFIKGYSEGLRSEDGRPQILKLKDWPPSSNLEEFLLCQRPEFLINFPLVDFIHSRCGLLNLAAKMPHDTTQPELGPNLLIAYGSPDVLGQDGSLSNLQINMGDVVYMLMHTADVHNRSLTRSGSEQSEKTCEELNAKRPHGNSYVPDHSMNLDGWTQLPNLAPREQKEGDYTSGVTFKEEKTVKDQQCNGPENASIESISGSSNSVKENLDNLEEDQDGVIWDVFHRQDVPKLNEYLRACSNEIATTNQLSHVVTLPVYDQIVVLDKDQKRILKEEYKIEPWTFRQHVGEAVFVPAGCPFQVKNLQSSVQLVLDFLSPESLRESARMAQEIRCLPNDHVAKLKMFEVGKISLYAASSAIREIQKISVDPNCNSDITFDDRNLTAIVSENLEKITKRRQVLCN